MSSGYILSDNGASSGSAGLKSGGGNDGTLLLQTTTSGGAVTTAVTVDNSQNVGVGVTPASNNRVDAYNASGDCYIRSKTGTSGTSGFFSENSTHKYFAGVNYSAADAWQVYDITNGGARLTVDASGNLLVGTTSTSGSMSNTARTLVGGVSSAVGSFASPPSGAWTSIATMTQAGMYLVHAYIPNYAAGPGNWSGCFIVSYTGSNAGYVYTFVSGSIQCQVVTNNVIQIYCGAGTGPNVNWQILRIA